MKKIGLFGFGCVGQGLYQLLRKEGFEGAVISKVVVRNRDKQRMIDPALLSYDFGDILNNPEIDIVIEAIDDVDAAYQIVRAALQKGLPTISANKKMIATHLDELIALQREFGTPFLYEAAVCGSIPVINKLEELYRYEPIQNVQGIFNGTSNYILSRLFQDKVSYDDALKQAQALGFAETDPTSDVGGYDAKYKSIILSKHAFGVSFLPEEVFNYGIDKLTKDDIQFARNQGLKIKLVPSIFNAQDRIGVFVIPQFVSREEQIFGVEDEFNAVLIESEYAGKQCYYGRGAGAFPTAFSIFSDLRDILAEKKYDYKKELNDSGKLKPENIVLEIYLRYNDDAIRKAFGFETVREGLLNDDYKYVIGETTLEKLILLRTSLLNDQSALIATGKKWIRPEAAKRSILFGLLNEGNVVQ